MRSGKRLTLTVLCSSLASPAFAVTACDLGNTVAPSAVSAVAEQAAGCPDLASVEAVAALDFAQAFELEAEAAGRVESGVRAALALDAFAAQLDADLAAACTNLATDLGKSGSWTQGPEACRAAISAMGDARQQLGGGATVELTLVPPRCGVEMDAMANCLAECDAELEPGQVDLACEPGKLSGQCEAKCEGTCQLEGAARCDGTCQGACSAKFQGRCGGECTGTCDGEKVDGAACAGTCQGECSAKGEGSCGGECTGSCELSAAAECGGTCHGGCTGEMKAPRCRGDFDPPKASASCKAQCEADLQAAVQCEPAQVGVLVAGGGQAGAVAKYKAALEKNLPAVFEIAVGMKDQALGVAEDARAVVVAAQDVVTGLASKGTAGARLGACVAAPFKAALDAAGQIRANVDVSVEVRASASASGSASGSAKAAAG